MTLNQSSTAAEPLHTPRDAGREETETAFASEAAVPVHGSPRASCSCEEAIRKTVARLLQTTRVKEERRWTPRVEYVRAASIHLREARNCETDGSRSLPAVVIDLSFSGASALCWQEIPVRHVLLEVSGVCFACNVRWRRMVGDDVYRYGLHFHNVVDKPTPAER
jgi:hypothetical protein